MGKTTLFRIFNDDPEDPSGQLAKREHLARMLYFNCWADLIRAMEAGDVVSGWDHLSIRLTPDEYQLATREAQLQGVSPAQWIAVTIREVAEKLEKDRHQQLLVKTGGKGK